MIDNIGVQQGSNENEKATAPAEYSRSTRKSGTRRNEVLSDIKRRLIYHESITKYHVRNILRIAARFGAVMFKHYDTRPARIHACYKHNDVKYYESWHNNRYGL